MPCYEPPMTADEIERFREDYARSGQWDRWYDLTPQRAIEQWLCDALHGRPAHADCLRWWEIHKRREATRR